jgi:hypothetical protein
MQAGVDGVDGVDGIPSKPDSPCGCSINYKAVLAMQCSGLGLAGGESTCGMLGLANFMTRRAWGESETIVGKHECDVTSQVTLENLEKEIALSPRDPSNRNYHDLVQRISSGERTSSI